VITGANGSGKSSLYRALRLLADCGQGRVIGSLAREGGLQSALWAGPESLAAARRGAPVQGTVRSGPVSLRLGYASDGFGYLGRPRTAHTQLVGLRAGPGGQTGDRVHRRPDAAGVDPGAPAAAGSPAADRVGLADPDRLAAQPSQHADRVRRPGPGAGAARGAGPDSILAVLRRIPRGCVGTGPAASGRTRTPVLADDGSDLAAAIQTIIEQGPSGPRSDGDLSTAIADAFDGAQVEVSAYNGVFEISLRQPGMLRPLRAAELSDGTLRYLLWAAALLTVDPPGLMVLNEPETSLHPDLLPALGRLISRAADRTQLLVVSHSRPLIQHLGLSGSLQGESDRREIELVKDLGETRIPGQGLLTTPVWSWGSR